MDVQITESIQDCNTLEEAILDIEDTQDRILEKVNLIDIFIRMHFRPHTPDSVVASSSVPLVAPMPPTSTQHSEVVFSPPPVDAQPPTSTRSNEFATTDEFLPHLSTTISSIMDHEPTTVTAHTTTLIVTPQLHNTSHLPKLELPMFSGNPLSWRSFWDSFDAAVNTKPTLSLIHKFNYLKVQLQGDAAQAIADLLLTEMNYAQSITLLKQHFGQPDKLINAHTHAFIDLPGPMNELSSLQLFHDIAENHITGFTSLKVLKDSYGTILVPIIHGKFLLLYVGT